MNVSNWGRVDGRRTGALDLAIFCTDARERLVGELWQTLDLTLQAETDERALTDGLRHTASVPVTATARFCKVVRAVGGDSLALRPVTRWLARWTAVAGFSTCAAHN